MHAPAPVSLRQFDHVDTFESPRKLTVSKDARIMASLLVRPSVRSFPAWGPDCTLECCPAVGILTTLGKTGIHSAGGRETGGEKQIGHAVETALTAARADF